MSNEEVIVRITIRGKNAEGAFLVLPVGCKTASVEKYRKGDQVFDDLVKELDAKEANLSQQDKKRRQQEEKERKERLEKERKEREELARKEKEERAREEELRKEEEKKKEEELQKIVSAPKTASKIVDLPKDNQSKVYTSGNTVDVPVTSISDLVLSNVKKSRKKNAYTRGISKPVSLTYTQFGRGVFKVRRNYKL